MGATKFAVEDGDFYLKMRGAASTLMERGTVVILELTGMHVKSLCSLTPAHLRKEGKYHYLYWERPQKGKRSKEGSLRRRIPKEDLSLVSEWLSSCTGKSDRWYRYLVEDVGERAGFENVSPNTYRHQRAVLLVERRGVRYAASQIGCSYKTLEKHYLKWDPEAYFDEDPDEEEM